MTILGHTEKRNSEMALDARPRRGRLDGDAAAAIAIDALAYIAGDPGRLGGFITATGLAPEAMRAAAAEPGFLAAVLGHLAADESLLLAFAADHDLRPDRVAEALALLDGGRGYD